MGWRGRGDDAWSAIGVVGITSVTGLNRVGRPLRLIPGLTRRRVSLAQRFK